MLGSGRHIWVDFLLTTFAPSSGQTFWCELSCVHSLLRKFSLESLVIIWICLGCWGVCLSCWRSYCTAASTGVAVLYSCKYLSHLTHSVQLEGKISRGWMQWRSIRLHVSQSHWGHTEGAQTVPEEGQSKPAQTFTWCMSSQPDSSKSFPNKAHTAHLWSLSLPRKLSLL